MEIMIKISLVIRPTPKKTTSRKKKNKMKLIAKPNPLITQGARKKVEFLFSKDIGMYVCLAGHLAIRKVQQCK